MAIAFQGTDTANTFPGTSISKNITITGENVTILYFTFNQAIDGLTTPTVNGQPMTQIGTTYIIPAGSSSATNRIRAWKYNNAPVGTVTIACSYSSQYFASTMLWYTGTDDVNVNNVVNPTESVSPVSRTVNISKQNSWAIIWGQPSVGAATAGSGTTARQTVIGFEGDSDTGLSIGNNTLNVNIAGNPNYQNFGIFELKPASSPIGFYPMINLLGQGQIW